MKFLACKGTRRPRFPTRSLSKRIAAEPGAIRSSSCWIRACSDGDRYFDVFVEYAKAFPEDLLVRFRSSTGARCLRR